MDLISRQAALEKVRTMQTYKLFVGDDMILVDKADVQTELMMLPSVQPEPKEGHWIPVTNGRGGHECNKCHEYAPSYQNSDEHLTRFCPYCGTKMKGE